MRKANIHRTHDKLVFSIVVFVWFTPGLLPSHAAGQTPCVTSDQCADGNACTQDACLSNFCVNTAEPGCIPCSPTYTCAPIDIVFILDTSGSMKDEEAALCSTISQIVSNLEALGVSVSPSILGISQTPDHSFSCISSNVITLFGDAVPGDAPACPFGDPPSIESWGPATAIVAERFPWRTDATRLIIPLSDEGPCNGSRPDGCNDPGDDRDSIDNAIAVAQLNHVIVSPITGTGAESCVTSLADVLAGGTSGMTFSTTDAGLDLPSAVQDAILASCSVDTSCDDGDACTIGELCTEGICTNGQPKDCSSLDGDCTLGVCDGFDGECMIEPRNVGLLCDDGDDCTIVDTCRNAGQCIGTSVTLLPCFQDSDCPTLMCDTDTNSCRCPNTPILTLEFGAQQPQPGTCIDAQDKFVVHVVLQPGTTAIAGGQFLIEYDAAVLSVISAEPGATVDPASPFTLELANDVRPIDGTIFYAVGIGIGGTATTGPAVMAAIRFAPLTSCVDVQAACFVRGNQFGTFLSDDSGQSVLFTTRCLPPMRIGGTPPILQCPESVAGNADAGNTTTVFMWDPPVADGGCGGVVTTCNGVHDDGMDLTSLAEFGGEFPTGVTHFECTVSDDCGVETSCQWTAEVRPQNSVDVALQLSPVIADQPIHRCIEFEFFSDCVQNSFVIQQDMKFGGLFDFPGRASGQLLKIPSTRPFVCATARDPLHTLRSTVFLEIVDDVYVAAFERDPFFGGNWLVGGNLNGDRVIDILDFGIYASAPQGPLQPDSPCGTIGPHVDINGDGVVDVLDFTFISSNFGMADKNACCVGSAASTQPEPVTSISLYELRAMGLGNLASADLNGDGILNADDMAMLSGKTTQTRVGRLGGSRKRGR